MKNWLIIFGIGVSSLSSAQAKPNDVQWAQCAALSDKERQYAGDGLGDTYTACGTEWYRYGNIGYQIFRTSEGFQSPIPIVRLCEAMLVKKQIQTPNTSPFAAKCNQDWTCRQHFNVSTVRKERHNATIRASNF